MYYTVHSRVKTYDSYYCIGEFKKSAIKVNKDALLEYECLKYNDLFSTIKRNSISVDRKQSIQMQELFQVLQYLPATKSIDLTLYLGTLMMIF